MPCFYTGYIKSIFLRTFRLLNNASRQRTGSSFSWRLTLNSRGTYSVFDLFCRNKAKMDLRCFYLFRSKKWNMDLRFPFFFSMQFYFRIWNFSPRLTIFLTPNREKQSLISQSNLGQKNLLTYSNWNMNLNIEIVFRDFLKSNFLDLRGYVLYGRRVYRLWGERSNH